MNNVADIISQNLHQERVSRIRNTLTSSSLLLSGLIATIPLFTTNNPVELVQYCPTPCKDAFKQVGIARLVDTERLNSPLFKRSVKVLDYQPADQPYGGLQSSLGCALMGAGLLLFSLQTKKDLLFLQQKYQELKKVALITEYSATKEVEVAVHQIDAQTAQSKGEGTFWLLNQLPTSEQNLIGAATQNQVDLGQLQYQYQLSQLQLETTRLEVEKKQLEDKLTTTKVAKKLSPVGEIIEQLDRWEDGWLSKIISGSKPLIITGCQGSGKTWTASTIAVIRQAMGSQVEYLIDRHYHGDNQEVWSFLDVKKAATDETEIGAAMDDCTSLWGNRIAQKTKDKIQVVVDEFTHLPKLVGESASKFIELGLSDTRKAGCQLLLISHNLTNNSFGSGTKDYRTNGTVCIKKYSNDGMKPLDRVTVHWGLIDENGNDLRDTERTLPKWFQPSLIYDHLLGNKPISF